MKYYLNVGGINFVTTKDTLIHIPFFNALFNHNNKEFLNNSENNPYFIDRDPKAFRCLLNLVQNLDFIYPEKYKWDLEFWGIDPNCFTEEYKETKNIQTSFQESILDKVRQSSGNIWFDSVQNAENTFHRKVWRHSTIFSNNIITINPDKEGKFILPEGSVCINLFLTLPKSIPPKDFKHFTVTLSTMDDKYNYSHSLDICDVWDTITTIDNLHYFQLFDGFLNSNCSGFVTTKNIGITISVSTSNNYQTIPTSLKYVNCKMTQFEYTRNLTLVLDTRRQVPIQHNIIDNTVTIEDGYVRYIIWRTDRKIDWVKLKINNEYQIITRGDFQYLERKKVGRKVLPKCYGCLYFCKLPNECDTNSGGLQICNNKYVPRPENHINPTIPEVSTRNFGCSSTCIGPSLSLIFPEGTNGIVWQMNFKVFKRVNDSLGIIDD